MIVEALVDCIMAGVILLLLIALVLCIGAAIWAGSANPEEEPWRRESAEDEEKH